MITHLGIPTDLFTPVFSVQPNGLLDRPCDGAARGQPADPAGQRVHRRARPDLGRSKRAVVTDEASGIPAGAEGPGRLRAGQHGRGKLGRLAAASRESASGRSAGERKPRTRGAVGRKVAGLKRVRALARRLGHSQVAGQHAGPGPSSRVAPIPGPRPGRLAAQGSGVFTGPRLSAGTPGYPAYRILARGRSIRTIRDTRRGRSIRMIGISARVIVCTTLCIALRVATVCPPARGGLPPTFRAPPASAALPRHPGRPATRRPGPAVRPGAGGGPGGVRDRLGGPGGRAGLYLARSALGPGRYVYPGGCLFRCCRSQVCAAGAGRACSPAGGATST